MKQNEQLQSKSLSSITKAKLTSLFSLSPLRSVLKKQPFVCVALCVLLGIALSWYITFYYPVIVVLGLCIIVSHFKTEWKHFTPYSILILLTFVVGHISFYHSNPLTETEGQKYEWKGIIIKSRESFSRGYKYLLRLEAISNGSKEQKLSGVMQVLTKDTTELAMGTQVLFQGKCKVFTQQDTSFWDRFAYSNGIHASVWTSQLFPTGETHLYYSLLGKAQSYFKQTIFEQYENKESASLAVGILLGDKSEMDKQTQKEFIETGAAHILAVSGLHVNILIIFFSWLAAPFMNKKFLTLLLITLILFYMILTDCSPAVMRASLMGILFLIAQNYHLNYNLYNTLFACFSFQLLTQPLNLFHLGFWLSYLAVWGIAFFSSFFNSHDKNCILQWFKQNLAISISAQLATLPILVGFLGNFPCLFLITNLVTLPISVIATYAGFFHLLVSFIPYFNAIAAYFAKHSFQFTLKINDFLAELPFASLQFKPNILLFIMVAFLIIGLATILYIRKPQKQTPTPLAI